MTLTQYGERIVAAGLDPNDDRAATVWYSTDDGITWTAASTWPRGEVGSYRFILPDFRFLYGYPIRASNRSDA